jgi:hypothetical protein
LASWTSNPEVLSERTGSLCKEPGNCRQSRFCSSRSKLPPVPL